MGVRLLGIWLAAGLSLAGCTGVPVVQGVGEAEANRAVAALDRAGVAASKAPDEATGAVATYRVDVPERDVARAVTVLAAAEVPRREQPGFAETYGARGLVQDAAEERARAAQAVAGELSRTLESMDGVLAARVHVALPGPPDLGTDAPPPRPTASVLVIYVSARPPYDDTSVRRLVAGAVEGLHPDDVTVVGMRRPPVAAAPALAHVGTFVVARSSAAALRGTLYITAGAFAALVALLGWTVRRRRSPGG